MNLREHEVGESGVLCFCLEDDHTALVVVVVAACQLPPTAEVWRPGFQPGPLVLVS